MPKARIVYSGKGKLEVPENVGGDIECDEYVSMSPASTIRVKIRILSVLYASPIVVSP
ncbi:MAG: hypothetical protein WA139_01545 [Candidatus Aenigmatarchaeota archaeon]